MLDTAQPAARWALAETTARAEDTDDDEAAWAAALAGRGQTERSLIATTVDDRAGAIGYGDSMGCFAAMNIRAAA
jgi:hypothetical protein